LFAIYHDYEIGFSYKLIKNAGQIVIVFGRKGEKDGKKMMFDYLTGFKLAFPHNTVG
jgi:hypothetical protein